MKQVAVVGGGISGLSAAWQLASLNRPSGSLKILLFDDPASQLGGWIKSVSLRNTLFEEGPRTIRPVGSQGAATLDLIYSLNLQHKVLPIPKLSPAATTRYIFYNNKILKLPSSLPSLLSSNVPYLRGLVVSALLEPFRTLPKDDISIDYFFSRRFNSRLADLGSAVVHGIFAGDSRKLSMKSCFPAINPRKSLILSLFQKGHPQPITWQPLQHPESQPFINGIQSTSAMYTLQNGLQSLTNALTRELRKFNVEIIRERVIAIEPQSRTLTTRHSTYKPSAIISALPAHALAKTLPESSVRDALAEIPFITIAVVNLAYTSKLPHDGFGYLVPRSQVDSAKPVLGCIFDTNVTKAAGVDEELTRVTVMIGGWWFDSKEVPSDSKLREMAVEAVRNSCGLEVPVMERVSVHRESIAQYVIGHADRVSRIENAMGGGIRVVGASYRGVGINDCVLGARLAAKNVFEDLDI
ncbi:oxygen-dependent protoporphyrinogen oxidase [Nowakowskiella sp. JEL0078]|nr:oxygen-dependent protoporphyrinogen oxidase [Nowakowskiella sp. JEL0078]